MQCKCEKKLCLDNHQ